MITVCLDTSHTFLTIVLVKDGQLIGSLSKECWKHQSEEIFVQLNALLDQYQYTSDDIGAFVITDGPGSYTGVRIAMTIAKVFCSLKHIPLYTISSLALFAGLQDGRVILDARGKRVYTAVYQHGQCIEKAKVCPVDELPKDDIYLGDVHLLDQPAKPIDFSKNFIDLIPFAKQVENVHLLVPEYLKDSQSYQTKC